MREQGANVRSLAVHLSLPFDCRELARKLVRLLRTFLRRARVVAKHVRRGFGVVRSLWSRRPQRTRAVDVLPLVLATVAPVTTAQPPRLVSSPLSSSLTLTGPPAPTG